MEGDYFVEEGFASVAVGGLGRDGNVLSWTAFCCACTASSQITQDGLIYF